MNTNKIILLRYLFLDGYYDYLKSVWHKKILEYNSILRSLCIKKFDDFSRY